MIFWKYFEIIFEIGIVYIHFFPNNLSFFKKWVIVFVNSFFLLLIEKKKVTNLFCVMCL